ncbi:MAG: cell division protein FtsA [Candidatus Babeliales bacterium]
MKRSIFHNEPIIAIDVGTTKICVLVAQAISADELEIIGIGKTPSEGLRKGIVVDINKTVYSIKKAVQDAELMAGCKIDSAIIGISGSHIQSINSQGVVPIKRSEVTQQDINNVIISAQAIPISEGKQILHVLPQYFMVDGQERVQDPIGMHGVRLEVQVHIITGSISCVQNLIKCCQIAGVQATDIVLEQLASALAVLSSDEQQLGVSILDIGGGTSDLALYYNKSIFYTSVIPVAGNHFTNDLALGLCTTLEDAERVKKEHGFVYEISEEFDKNILVESIEGTSSKKILLTNLTRILRPRAQELFVLVNEKLNSYEFKSFMPSGLVLTGGGSLLEGMQELAQETFKIPVRIGNPGIKYSLLQLLNSPIYATGYGLLLHALKKHETLLKNKFTHTFSKRVVSRMKSWVSDFF